MRIRSVKPEWLEDEEIALAPLEARVASVALILLSDDEGRFRCSTHLIAGSVFPGRSDGVELAASALDYLEGTGFLIRYQGSDGKTYAYLPGFLRHQKIDKATRSRLPPPPPRMRGDQNHGNNATSEDSPNPPRVLGESSANPPGGVESFQCLDLGSRILDLGSTHTPCARDHMETEEAPPESTRRPVARRPQPPAAHPSPAPSAPPTLPPPANDEGRPQEAHPAPLAGQELQALADRALHAPHEWTWLRPSLEPAIAACWDAWRVFVGKPELPCPRTQNASRALLEALANGHTVDEIREALLGAHPQCWARTEGQGIGAALCNLDALKRPAAPKGGRGGPRTADGRQWVTQEQTDEGAALVADLWRQGREQGEALARESAGRDHLAAVGDDF